MNGISLWSCQLTRPSKEETSESKVRINLCTVRHYYRRKFYQSDSEGTGIEVCVLRTN